MNTMREIKYTFLRGINYMRKIPLTTQEHHILHDEAATQTNEIPTFANINGDLSQGNYSCLIFKASS